MPGGSGIDRLPRRPVVGQQICPVDGQPLRRCNGQGITVIETYVVVIVAYLIVTECDLAPFVRARRDLYRGSHRLQTVSGLIHASSATATQNPEFLYRHDGAVEELLLPLRCPDAEPVADGDLQRLDNAPILRVTADLDNYPRGIRLPRQMALAHEMG